MLRFALPPGILLALVLVIAPAEASDWELVWSDEFSGSALDPGKWQPQIGTGCPSLCGWGNNELQYYRAENATVAGGMLTIEAREESFGGRNYTSARLRTLGRADWLYGRFEMRAKLPTGKGLWPAFWMLPSDSVYGVWAASGEIDIMEIKGSQPNRLSGTIHFGGTWPENIFAGQSTVLTSGDFGDDFHVFALEWEPTEIRWYLDGKLYATQTNWWSNGQSFPAPFDENFHLLLNVAVGGNYDGNPDASTVFPQQMVVDYVRVYRNRQTCQTAFDSMDHALPHSNGWFQFGGSVGGGGIGGSTTDVAPGTGSSASIEAGFGSSGAAGFVGGFGRNRDMDLTGFTHFEMWINPDPGASYILELNLQDDDNGDGSATSGTDDEFQYELQIGGEGSEVIAGGGWQKVSIPLTDFVDDNSYLNGGNGILDTAIDGNGMMTGIVVAIINQSGTSNSFRTDGWAFTRRTASVAGRVWEDLDGNGVEDAGEPGISGVDVQLLDGSGAMIATTTVASDGTYSFAELVVGEFEVVIDTSTLPAGMDPTHDPDGAVTPNRFATALDCDGVQSDGDFGYRSSVTSTPGTVVFRDRLYGASPNPFNAHTVVSFDLSASGAIELVVYDAQGRRVRTLESGEWAAGSHQSIWDGTDSGGRIVASGVYYVSLTTARAQEYSRMVLLK